MGEYEVVVVNPDGDVGVLTTPTFKVLDPNDPPPIITELVPGLVDAATYDQVMNIIATYVEPLADEDKAAVFGRTAAEFYQLEES